MKLGILQIDLDLAIFQKTAVGIRDSWLSVFSIIMLRVFFILGILAHLLHSHDIISIIQHYSKIYTAGSAEDFYILVIDQST